MSNKPEIRKVIHLPKIRMLGRGRAASGVRITNVKSIKPPDPELVKKLEAEKLRAKLQKEIERRSRKCQNKTYECTLPVVGGREYCASHVTQDPAAPYRPCAHAGVGGARCDLPAPRNGDRRDAGLCFEHAREALLQRQRSAAPPPPVASTETLLNQLQHYVKAERTRTTSCASSVSVVSEPDEMTVGVVEDPFKQIDATRVNRAYTSAILECASDEDSPPEEVDGAPDPPGDETPEHDYHVMRHAGIFTAEEVVKEAKTALQLLQTAYIGQMGRLETLLHIARYDYLKALKAEREQYCSISSQAVSDTSAHSRRQLRRLRAYAARGGRRGAAAVLARRLLRRRAKINETANRPVPSAGRCTFAEGGVRCAAVILPATKHCLRHIMRDRYQVLYTECGDSRGGVRCHEPLPRAPAPSPRCRYHTLPPDYTVFTIKKDESDTESDARSASDDSHDEADRSGEERSDAPDLGSDAAPHRL